jgi:hypothetical protein
MYASIIINTDKDKDIPVSILQVIYWLCLPKLILDNMN